MLLGSRLLAFASRWFDEQTVASVFQPLVADWQHESAAATGVARVLANIRGRLAFATVSVANRPTCASCHCPGDDARASADVSVQAQGQRTELSVLL